MHKSIFIMRRLILLTIALLLAGSTLVQFSSQPARADSLAASVFLPITSSNSPYYSPFSFEINNKMLPGTTLLERGTSVGARWVRLNRRVNWRRLQPTEGGPIQWDLQASFERELRQLKAAGIRPVVIVDDFPLWAVQPKNSGDDPPQPSLCAPLKPDKVDDFAAFARAIAERYKTTEYNVHDWELGNEPDIDPKFVLSGNEFGCWGDVNDYYYGGEAYGEMIIAASQAIKAEDPRAKIWLGGLLLPRPEPTDPVVYGHPERFFQGILEAGAAPYFDIVPYHYYPSYTGSRIDHDTSVPQGPWNGWGGGTLGKAAYLRQVMAQYGIDKPLVLNETALGCPENWARCDPPPADFFEAQADYVVRTFTRGASANITGFTWYTLDGPGWRYTGLMDENYNVSPGYNAYQQLTQQLKLASYAGPVDYGSSYEGYAFNRGTQQVHVVWAKLDTSGLINVPASKFVAAYSRDGAPLTPGYSGDNAQLTVGFSPVYVVRLP